jgi:hypothetical protein
MFVGLGLIIVIIVVVSIIIATKSRKDLHSGSGTEGASIPRRLWLYLITLVSLGIFAAGVGQLLTLLADTAIKGSTLTRVGEAAFNQQQLSLGLAMTVIGGPLWFLFWRAVQRHIRANQDEAGNAIRKLILNIVLLATALTGIIAASNLLEWLLAGVQKAELPSSELAIVIVTGAIWCYHWLVSEGEGHPSPTAETLRRWYVYVLSGFGLVWLAVGLVHLIDVAVINLPVWENTLVRGQFWNNTAQMSIAQILLGGLAWYFHWFRMARGDFDSTLRQVYFYLLTISGGAITVLVTLTILIYRFLVWAFDAAGPSSSPYFQFLGWAVSTILVGLAIWGYHRRLAQEESSQVQEKRQSAQRIYIYLMSFLGLGTLATGLSFLFGTIIDLIIDAAGTSLTVSADWWQDQVSLFLALLVVGTPIWLYYWNSVLKLVQAGGIEEWRSLSRRIFLYVIVGASIITVAADLVNIIYQLLNGALQDNFGVNVLRDSKWSLQTLIVAVPLLWYHWRILRADQRQGAEAVVVHRKVTFLVDDRSGELVSRLENKLGYKVRNLYHVVQTTETPPLPDEEIDRLVNEIQSSPSDKVMLVVVGGKVITLPYQDK